jgi:hypothetical protein
VTTSASGSIKAGLSRMKYGLRIVASVDSATYREAIALHNQEVP